MGPPPTRPRLPDAATTRLPRCAVREAQLRQRLTQLAELERGQVQATERQRLMRDLHDGLGSRMFTALARIERGETDARGIAHALRDCIADMRLIFEVIPLDGHTLGAAWIDFRHRWELELRHAKLQGEWRFEVPEEVQLSSLLTLQLLRIAQEALTNVLRHAEASTVSVQLLASGSALHFKLIDDGRGFAPQAKAAGRGLANMRARAQKLGATLDIESDAAGTQVILRMPLHAQGA